MQSENEHLCVKLPEPSLKVLGYIFFGTAVITTVFFQCENLQNSYAGLSSHAQV